MNYAQTLAYLYSKLPMFSRTGAAAIKKDLGNTLALCSALNNPHRQFKSIHIGGTNGKGSTSHILAAVLQSAGYKTGLYTSPHLKDFRERIRINGKMIPKKNVVNFVKQQSALMETLQPSFFEVTVAMAFEYFAQEKVDIAVIEVGLGGRLDSTNIIMPELSVITNISFDHTNLLGNTLPVIAAEKAGIIKKNTPVIIGEYQHETAKVFEEKAAQENAPIIFADRQFEVMQSRRTAGKLSLDIAEGENLTYPALKPDLTGTYQEKNILTVLAAVEQLQKKGIHITKEALYTGIQHTKKLSGLKGRWQTLSRKPLVICDTGHNEAGIREVLKNISLTPHHKLHFVIGMVKDKDISAVLGLLPCDARYYFCMPQLERALPATELREQAAYFGLKGDAYPSVREAVEAAKKHATTADFVFIGGSTFVVAEII